MKIKAYKSYSEYAELAPLGGCSDYGEVGLNSYQVDFLVGTDDATFEISYQSEDRTNGLRNYAGWEMSLAEGVSDDQRKLLNFLDENDDHDIFKEMENKANTLAKECLYNLKLERLEEVGFPVVVNSLGQLKDFLDAYSKLSNDEHWIKRFLTEEYQNIPFNGYELDYSSMPTFGGVEPGDTTGVWSWDDNNLLVGEGELEIVSRKDFN